MSTHNLFSVGSKKKINTTEAILMITHNMSSINKKSIFFCWEKHLTMS